MSEHFTDDELRCRGTNCCGGKNLIDGAFLMTLERIRQWYGKPMVINSGYRCPVHNKRVAKTGEGGPHTHGRAVDVAVSGTDAFTLVRIALSEGITGLGIQQKGMGRMVHLDDLPNTPTSPRPRIWSY